ncbi:MAG: TIGR02147 family protein [Myxococcales bacterium]|nr:TIGR02147 family protein [Myxococcales bacterium]
MRKQEVAPNVFAYLDARAWLRDTYAHRKATSRGFSFRAFSRRAGLKSPNYLKLVIDGERNLTTDTAQRFGRAFGLEGQALSYFLDLVAFTQARTTDEKSALYERLLRFREHRAIHRIDIAYGLYHSRWYIPAIRELTFRPDCPDDPAWIADRLVPRVPAHDVAGAVDLLVELGLVERNEGRLRPTEPLVTTGPEVRSVHVLRYHRTMMERARAALDELPASERDISSVTLCLGDDGIARLKDVLRTFRRQLLQLSDAEPAPTRVVQVNLQLFPLTRAEEDE